MEKLGLTLYNVLNGHKTKFVIPQSPVYKNVSINFFSVDWHEINVFYTGERESSVKLVCK